MNHIDGPQSSRDPMVEISSSCFGTTCFTMSKFGSPPFFQFPNFHLHQIDGPYLSVLQWSRYPLHDVNTLLRSSFLILSFHFIIIQWFSGIPPELILLKNPLDRTVFGPLHLNPIDGIYSSLAYSFLLYGL
jgi:hypothetical protein